MKLYIATGQISMKVYNRGMINRKIEIKIEEYLKKDDIKKFFLFGDREDQEKLQY